MNKLFIIFLFFSYQTQIFCSEKKELEIEIGSILYHLNDVVKNKKRERSDYFRHLALFKYNSFMGGVFKNSYKADSYALGLEKSFLKKQKNAINLDLGYSIGIVSGYCRGEKKLQFYEKCKDRKSTVAPFGRIYSKLRIKNISFNISYSLLITYATISFYL